MARYIKPRFLLSLFLCFAMPAVAQVSELTATVDKNPVMVDESFVLTLTATGDADRDAIDTSPLLQDFIVGRTSVSSQTQIINFSTSRTTTWSTVLIPRQQGVYTIPSFAIDGQQSAPITMTVLPVSQSSATQGRDLYITTEIDDTDVYLHQQLVYTVKLHIALDLQRGSLQAPVMENADIRQLGKDQEVSEIVNGKRYRVIKRNFAIIPQRSGKFTIQGPLFEGEVLANNTRQSFGFFNRTRSVNRIGPAIEINVKPIPTNYLHHWLPSEYVQLSEEWPGDPEYRVGEPITRTLTLSAVGVVEEQLPELPQEYPPSIKVYPDQGNTATVDRDDVLVSQVVESVALIPSQPGEFLLPSMSVPWFNTRTGQTEFAKLPSRTITVLPASAQTPLPNAPALPLPTSPSLPADQVTVPQPSIVMVQNPWWPVATGVVSILWLSTLYLWLRARRARSLVQVKTDVQQSDSSHWRDLQLSLSNGNISLI